MIRNCEEALNGCGYRSPGRVKWYTLTIPAGAEGRRLEFEVRTQCCPILPHGSPWIFLYYTNSDCGTPMRVQYEAQTVNGTSCMQEGGVTVSSIRLADFNLTPGDYIVGVGSGHFGDEESQQEFLVRAAITPNGNACGADDDCADSGMGLCVQGQCGNLSREPTDQHREFQCR